MQRTGRRTKSKTMELNMLQHTVRTYKNGAMSQTIPRYKVDRFRESLQEVEGLRKFAAMSGTRNASTAAMRQGWPIEITRAVLLSESVWRAANTFHEWRLSLSR